jgi:organic hydroperoxide reductase OsmC/OhrA
MAHYSATVRWSRGEQRFTDQRYSRRHEWCFDGGITVPGSSSPHVVAEPYSDPKAVDPEEAFVASLSSCHMLWFLSIAAGRGFLVDSYLDNATGETSADAQGRQSISRVVLRPHAIFSGAKTPSVRDIDAMHEKAHDECFIARSVRSVVDCEPVHAQALP